MPLAHLVTAALLSEAARRYPRPTFDDYAELGAELDEIQLSPAIRGVVLGELAAAVREGRPVLAAGAEVQS